MKKAKVFLSTLIASLFLATACSTAPATTTTAGTTTPAGSATTTAGSTTPTTGKKPKFVFVVTDQLGDKSFNDSAAAGMKKITSELGFETKIVEIGRDQTKWEPTILDLSEGGEYTAIILNGSGTQEIVERIAGDFPDQKYVLFDAAIEAGKFDNIYAISYKQNEGSYLGGVVAGLVTKSTMKFANADDKIGFIGGDQGPIISDFLVGYIEGAKSVNPGVKVYVSYVGSWTDTAKAKELANAQFSQGVDIIFPAAMTAGLGVIEAASEQNKYIIGVDSDQATLLGETDPKKADVILTSVIKEVGQSLFIYADKVGKGEAKYGITDVLGIPEKTTDIIENDYYLKNVPAEIRAKVTDARAKIVSGEIKVPTALDVEQSVVDDIVNSVKP